MDDLPGFTDYSMRNRTYKYHTGEVLYPFGHGLAYTSFAYSDPQVVVNADGTVTVTVDVANTGAMDGDEAVQLIHYVGAEAPALTAEQATEAVQTMAAALGINTAPPQGWDKPGLSRPPGAKVQPQ